MPLHHRSSYWSRIASAAALLAMGALTSLHPACVTNPDIDGSKVPTLGSDASVPACAPLCDRIAALCGYAPVDCVTHCDGFGDEQRVCIGQAPSCRDAIQTCTPPDSAGDAGDDDAGDEDAEPEEDAGPDDDAGDTDAVADEAGEDGGEDAGADAISDDASGDAERDGG